jgi:predicted nucleic acid-binding protein
MAYFDTSAYVKLLLPERRSPEVQRWWDEAETVVVSLVLYPEARSAIARARRNGRPVPFEVDETGIVIDEDMYGALVVTPT